MMKVLVIYCHPSNKSFTARMKDEFIRGLEDGILVNLLICIKLILMKHLVKKNT